MIAHIDGNILYIDNKYLIVDVNGIGYKVHTTTEILNGNNVDDKISLFTYLAVRENALDLFGFKDIEEMTFFEMLLSVSGIGPKSALGILSLADIDTIKRAIVTGDTSYLNKVSGIGKKTAERIVIDLKNKVTIAENNEHTDASMRIENDAIEALKSLGYSQNEARNALKEVSSDIVGVNAKIKQALKILSNK